MFSRGSFSGVKGVKMGFSIDFFKRMWYNEEWGVYIDNLEVFFGNGKEDKMFIDNGDFVGGHTAHQ